MVERELMKYFGASEHVNTINFVRIIISRVGVGAMGSAVARVGKFTYVEA